MNKYYLKPNVKIEPIVYQWYAWSHLIAPATAACNITQRLIPIMESYLSAPEVHAQAVKNPSLLGGPFIDLERQYFNDVAQLCENTKTQLKHLIHLANSIRDFDRYLQEKAEGNSLESLYHLIPHNLRGLIELVYDLNNHVSMRLIEPLFYRNFELEKHQSFALSIMHEDSRPFVLSTPRIVKAEEVHINIPFCNQAVDSLFSMKFQGGNYAAICDSFEVSPDKTALFKSFFTETPPTLAEDRNYPNNDIRVRYFGHACVLVQTHSLSILIDPAISYDVPGKTARYTFNDLPDEIDYVLITHNHQDHLLLEILFQLRHKIKNIVVPSSQKGALADPSLKFILQKLGFKSVICLDEFETLSLADGQIVSVPFLGEHGDLNVQTKNAYYIEIRNRKFFFAADSNNLDPVLYDHIFSTLGAIDILFLGMECEGAPLSWLYGSLYSRPLSVNFDKSRRLSGSDFNKSWDIVNKSRCKEAYVYAMGQEPWLNHIMALNYTPESKAIVESNLLIRECHKHGIVSERLFGQKQWFYPGIPAKSRNSFS